MKKSLLSLLVPVVVLFLLVSAPSLVVPVAAQDAAVSGTLSFLSWYTQDQYQPVLDAFLAQYPDVQIDYQNVPPANNQYVQRLQLLASSGELPDLFYSGPPITLMAENGYLADITDLEVVQALPEGYKQYYTYEDRVYAYAPDAWVGGVFYNIALFRDNNIAVPTTWDEFLAACAAFSELGVKPITMSADSIPDLIYWLHNTEVLSQDPNFDVRINTGETTFSEGYLDALTTWKTQLVDTGYISQDTVGLTDDQRFTEFATGTAAMTISGPWAVNGIMEKNPELELGLFPFVGSTPERAYTVGAVNVGIAISATAQNSAAAEAFINFLGSPEGLALYQQVTGNFIGADIEYEINPVMEPIRPLAENGQFAFPPVFWTYGNTLAPSLIRGTQEIILGTLTPEELAQQLDEQQAELAANGG